MPKYIIYYDVTINRSGSFEIEAPSAEEAEDEVDIEMIAKEEGIDPELISGFNVWAIDSETEEEI